MIRYALIFVCGVASGVLVYDTALERQAEIRSTIAEPYAETLRFTQPVSCDATVNGKCYIRGMK